MADTAKPQASHEEGARASLARTTSASEPYGSQKTTWYMIVFSIWVGMFGWLANFDSAFGGIVLVMEPYKQAFGKCTTATGPDGTVTETCSMTALQQSLTQLTVLFMGVGGLLSGLVGDRIGRRGGLQVGCLLVAVGAAGMLGTQGSFVSFMVCRCIGGVGIGVLYSTAPTYGSESVAPQKRGFLMSFYNVGLACGNVIAAAVCVGSSKLTTNWAWRTPIICQIPVALILGTGTLLFCESPRWLLTKGKEEKARRSFAKFSQRDVHSPEIDAQVQAVVQHIEFERELERDASAAQLFRGVDLKRTHLAVLALIGNAITGVQFVIPYTALFLAQLGLSNPYTFNVAISSCILAGTVPGPFLCEYAGRRLTLLGGYAMMALSMLILAIVSSALGQANLTAQNVCVAFLCIWAFTFGATSGPVAWVSSAEMHSLRLRTIGQAYAVGIYEIFGFGAAFWTPYMLSADYGNMGTNVGYFYGGITIVVFILTFMFIPETARLSLEQIDEYFMTGEPAWKTSIGKNKKIAASSGVNNSHKVVD